MKMKITLGLLTFCLSCTAYSDRWATLAGVGDTIGIADGETALVVFAAGSSLLQSRGPNVEIQYNKTEMQTLRLEIGPTNQRPLSDGETQQPASKAAPSSVSPLPLVGPATLSMLTPEGMLGLKVVSTRFNLGASDSAVSGVPSNAVVIPEDAAGPVEIILESSTDLVTWNRAQPGSYMASDPSRFFRVRAVVSED